MWKGLSDDELQRLQRLQWLLYILASDNRPHVGLERYICGGIPLLKFNLKISENCPKAKAIGIVALLTAASLLLTYLATLLITWLMFECVDFRWSVKVGTGIWLAILLVRMALDGFSQKGR